MVRRLFSRTLRPVAVCAVAMLGCGSVPAQEAILPGDPATLSMRGNVEKAISQGLNYLVQSQSADGVWSASQGVTGRATLVLLLSPVLPVPESHGEAVGRAIPALASFLPDAPVENTAWAVLALSAAPGSAQRLLAAPGVALLNERLCSQLWQIRHGGNGPKGMTVADLALALEAFFSTETAVDPAAATPDIALLTGFLQRSQNLAGFNPAPWASADVENQGGFIDAPGHSVAGKTELPEGKVEFKSYGGATVAGYLAFLDLGIRPDDPRVKAASDWLRRHYDLAENPHLGQDGLFIWYHLLSKALNRRGQPVLVLDDGRQIEWRTELARRILDLQKPDGSWVNTNARWNETDPALCTALAVLTLQTLHSGL